MRGGRDQRRRVRVPLADRGVRGVDFRHRARGRAGDSGERRHARAGHDRPDLAVGTSARTAVDVQDLDWSKRDSERGLGTVSPLRQGGSDTALAVPMPADAYIGGSVLRVCRQGSLSFHRRKLPSGRGGAELIVILTPTPHPARERERGAGSA